MSQGPDATDAITVEEDGVTVEKRFTADEFPVPAVEFTLRSDREDATEFRLVDEIPENFPMDRIGFHPEYESEHWTAYQDHRVEYRRRLEAGGEVVTVYGIRTDDPDEGNRFLGEPTVAEVSEDDDPVGDVADVIGDDSSQAVRDVLAGDDIAAEEDNETDGLDLAGVESDLGAEDPADPLADDASDDGLVHRETEAKAEAESADDLLGDLADGQETADTATADEYSVDEPDENPADDEADAEPVDERLSLDTESDDDADELEAADDESDVVLDLEDDAGDEQSDDPGATDTAPDDEPLDPNEDEPTAAEEVGDDGAATSVGAVGGAAGDGVAAALAAELRAGTVSEEDKVVLTEELELDHSTSVDARVSRLQSKVEDMAAYSNALEEFIDENGLASEWVDGLQADMDELTADIVETQEAVADAADDRESLREEVESVREEAQAAAEEVTLVREGMDGLGGDVDDLSEEVGELGDDVADTAESLESSLESSLEEVRADVDDLAEEVADEDEAVAEVREELASLGDEVESVSALVDDELSEMRSQLGDVHDDLEEFEEFRTRLSSVFGPGGAADGTGAADADEQ